MTESDCWNLAQRLTIQIDTLNQMLDRIAIALEAVVPPRITIQYQPQRPPADLESLTVVNQAMRTRWAEEERHAAELRRDLP